MQTYSKLRIAPFRELLASTRGGSDHWGGPAFEDWAGEVYSRHCRSNNRPLDKEPLPPAGEVLTMKEEVAYLGPLCHHFGHQLADFSMRIRPTLRSGFQGRLVFAVRSGHALSLSKAPRFFLDILNYLEVPLERVLLLGQDTVFDTVHIARQAETIFGSPPDVETLDDLDAVFSRKLSRPGSTALPPAKIIYVSRGKINRGVMAGERALETFMSRNGALVVYPEDHDIETLLRAYAAAEFVIFSEGSAMHTLQFLGRQLKAVIVINRSSASKFGENFLQGRCESLTRIDVVAGGLSASVSGRYRETGLSVLSARDLLEQLCEAAPLDAALWPYEEYEAAINASFERWVEEYLTRFVGLTRETPSIVTREAEAAGLSLSEFGMHLLKSRSLTQAWPETSGLEEAECAFGMRWTDGAIETLIDVSLREGRPERALGVAQMVVESAGQISPDIKAKLVQAFTAGGDKVSATRLATEVLDEEVSSASGQALGVMAGSLWSNGERDLAVRALDMAVRRAPETAWIWLRRASYERGLGLDASAVESALTALSLDPEWSPSVSYIEKLADDLDDALVEHLLERAKHIKETPALAERRAALAARPA